MPYQNVSMTVDEGCPAGSLIKQLGLQEKEVAAVFINGKVMPFDTLLADGDRVAFIPPGMPGPHPILLGMKKIP